MDMVLVPTTCGIFLIKDNLILLGHPTHSANSWTIPKGVAEQGELHEDAAIREFREETGIDLSKYKSQLVDLGKEPYTSKRKEIHGFLLKISEDVPEPKCTSMVTDRGEPFPELDSFVWVPYAEALLLVHQSQKQLLIRNRSLFE